MTTNSTLIDLSEIFPLWGSVEQHAKVKGNLLFTGTRSIFRNWTSLWQIIYLQSTFLLHKLRLCKIRVSFQSKMFKNNTNQKKKKLREQSGEEVFQINIFAVFALTRNGITSRKEMTWVISETFGRFWLAWTNLNKDWIVLSLQLNEFLFIQLKKCEVFVLV